MSVVDDPCEPPRLRVAAVQPLGSPHDVGGNARAHADLVRAAEARVVVFPELSLTGYQLDASVLDLIDDRLAPIVEACASTGSIALVGAPTAGDRGDHISMIAVDDSGARVVYDKIWLSDEEAERFVAGAEPAVFLLEGWRLGLAICRDTGVVAHADAIAASGMDAYVAGVAELADDVTVQEERARRVASTHDVWVVVASCAGPGARARSRIWSPDGAIVADAGPAPGGIAVTDLQRAAPVADRRRRVGR